MKETKFGSIRLRSHNDYDPAGLPPVARCSGISPIGLRFGYGPGVIRYVCIYGILASIPTGSYPFFPFISVLRVSLLFDREPFVDRRLWGIGLGSGTQWQAFSNLLGGNTGLFLLTGYLSLSLSGIVSYLSGYTILVLILLLVLFLLDVSDTGCGCIG